MKTVQGSKTWKAINFYSRQSELVSGSKPNNYIDSEINLE